MICIFLSLGIMQYPAALHNSLSLIKITLSAPFSTVGLMNNHIMKITDFDSADRKKTHVPSKPRKSKKAANLLFFVLNSMVLTNDKLLIFLLVIVFVGISSKVQGIARYGRKIRGSPGISVMKYYMKWSVRFLTPLQKFINSRSDVYDINPVLSLGARTYYPRTLKGQGTGIFFWFFHENTDVI
ncbi:MAG: hypothetical protein JXJ19_09595 [Elusimicrobia bacterium]|nr:hypothetical protein [Elusimicrobiota bacterium]